MSCLTSSELDGKNIRRGVQITLGFVGEGWEAAC